MSFQKCSFTGFSLLLLSVFALSACGSSAVKQRKEQRDKMAQSSKLYCEFVNGDVYVNDIDVALNIEMAKRCDTEKPYTVTPYKTPSESQGVIYCCSMTGRAARREAPVSTPKESKKDEPKAEASKADTSKSDDVELQD